MGMKRELSISIAAVAALVVTACGSSSGESIPTVPADGGLRAPTPIEVASSGSGADSTKVAAEGALAADDMMIAPWFDIEYVLGDGLVAPTDDTGYVFDATIELSAEEVSALAAALGVSGEPVRIDEGYGVSWRVGPDDGTEPSLWVYDDAMKSWNYSSAWATQEIGRGDCAVSVDSEGVETVDCPEPEAPVGVPTAEEAEARALELLGSLGVDAAAVEIDTYADDWFASVTANSTVDDRTVFTSWGFGFGADGVLQYASGVLATPEVVGPYPLVDIETAFDRLVDQSSINFGGGPLIADTEIAVESDIAVAPGASSSSDVAVSDEVPGGRLPAVAPIDGSLPEPETLVVTLVDVVADLWWVWDVDGNAWLLPAYRFVGDDGGWYVVPAVTDEFLVQSEVVPEPGVAEPGVAEPGAVGGDSGGTTGGEAVAVAEPGIVDDTVMMDDPADVEAEVRALWENELPMPLDDLTDEAAAQGFEVRIVIEDGEPLAATMDFKTRRINVEVASGDVVAIVSIG